MPNQTQLRTLAVFFAIYGVLAFVWAIETGNVAIPDGIAAVLPPDLPDTIGAYLGDVVRGTASPLALVAALILVGGPALYIYTKVQAWMDPVASTRDSLEWKEREHALSQGRIDARAIKRALGVPRDRDGFEPAIPLAYHQRQLLGLPWETDTGHVAIVGPTRSGKSFHLTEALLRWPGPVICVAPRGSSGRGPRAIGHASTARSTGSRPRGSTSPTSTTSTRTSTGASSTRRCCAPGRTATSRSSPTRPWRCWRPRSSSATPGASTRSESWAAGPGCPRCSR